MVYDRYISKHVEQFDTDLITSVMHYNNGYNTKNVLLIHCAYIIVYVLKLQKSATFTKALKFWVNTMCMYACLAFFPLSRNGNVE